MRMHKHYPEIHDPYEKTFIHTCCTNRYIRFQAASLLVLNVVARTLISAAYHQLIRSSSLIQVRVRNM
jgi:hypothetical protein